MTNQIVQELTHYAYSGLEQISSPALLEAVNLGRRGLPSHSESCIPYFKSHYHKFYALVVHVNQVIQPETLKLKVKTALDTKAESTRIILNTLMELEKKHLQLTQSIKRAKPDVSPLELISLVATPIIIGFDALWSAEAFMLMGLSNLSAKISAGLFGILLCAFCLRFPRLVRKSANPGRLIAGAAIFFLALFYLLGDIRATHLEALALEEGYEVHYSAWPFMLLSTFALALATILNITDYDTTENKAAWAEAKQLTEERKEIRTRIKELQTELKALETKTDAIIQEAAELLKTGDSLNQIIAQSAYGCFEDWKLQIRLHRPFVETPDWMDEAFDFQFPPSCFTKVQSHESV